VHGEQGALEAIDAREIRGAEVEDRPARAVVEILVVGKAREEIGPQKASEHHRGQKVEVAARLGETLRMEVRFDGVRAEDVDRRRGIRIEQPRQKGKRGADREARPEARDLRTGVDALARAQRLRQLNRDSSGRSGAVKGLGLSIVACHKIRWHPMYIPFPNGWQLSLVFPLLDILLFKM
jgi:hypothetical protein